MTFLFESITRFPFCSLLPCSENGHSFLLRAFPHERSPFLNVANCPVLCAERMRSAILGHHLKRMLLQIKSNHQKCACALKEGGVGTRSFIFLSEKLLYFFLGLCDYSDKFPKMFCSSCGMGCSSTAHFCHQCGQQLNLSPSRISFCQQVTTGANV